MNLKEYSFVNATHALNEKGETIVYRPQNVVGSYAVYRSDRKTGNIYTTGKIGHFYTPLIIDAEKKTIWANLSITKTTLTVTIPEDWLNKAVFPIIIDPSFGETDIGGSKAVPTAKRIYSYPHSLGEVGTVVSMTVYVEYNTPGDLMLGVYDDNSGDPNNLEGKTSSFACPVVTAWVTENFGTPFELSAGTYWLALISDGSTFYVYYDSVGTRKTRDYGVFDLPDPFGSTSSGTQTLSLFANYTVSGAEHTDVELDATAGVTSELETQKDLYRGSSATTGITGGNFIIKSLYRGSGASFSIETIFETEKDIGAMFLEEFETVAATAVLYIVSSVELTLEDVYAIAVVLFILAFVIAVSALGIAVSHRR